ncbi:cupin domain-containing protein [Conexibacter sp. SYSU D00693]|uniref:cupin domain-containing protein n=1 Tax=Conexibacter sp. SYSU D00693 TaxID=2812560 RepID=UPI00196A41C4|nr:cupin domain-containing protein [Conexibacter sp. SYSU D00693]
MADRPEWLENPVTGELGRALVHPDDDPQGRLVAELWLQPGAAVVGEHVHPSITETFEVRHGEVGFSLDGVTQVAGPGDALTVEPGRRHDWWNAGDGVAQVIVTVTPGLRFMGMIETLFGLAALGQVNAKGMPDPLWLAAIAHEFSDVVVFTRPPAVVQRAVFGPLAAIARRTGRDPLDPALHGEQCPAVVLDPVLPDLGVAVA